MRTAFARFARHTGGVTSIEYALIVGFIALGIIVSIAGIAPALNLTFNNVKTNVSRRVVMAPSASAFLKSSWLTGTKPGSDSPTAGI